MQMRPLMGADEAVDHIGIIVSTISLRILYYNIFKNVNI